ncbi:hypothetical protein ACFFX0_25555 [Citricoccus parietis]|uniref:Uncharacterized protein n=1 Tax=Citricoccus parietis TaxID=592307 RepID=A0ABV5G635_9MICC
MDILVQPKRLALLHLAGHVERRPEALADGRPPLPRSDPQSLG